MNSLEELMDWLEKLEQENKTAQVQSINKIGIAVLRDVISHTPVVTGNLRRKWKKTPVVKEGNKFTCDVYNPVEYGMYVELGHRTVNGGFVEGQYILRNAANRIENYAGGVITSELERRLK